MFSRGFVPTDQAGPVVAIISCTKRVNTTDLNTCYSFQQHVRDALQAASDQELFITTFARTVGLLHTIRYFVRH